MEIETEKIIKTQMEKLPPEIRSLFTDSELGNKIINIGKKNGIINIEQLGIFQTETNLVMLGLVHPDEYPNELKTQLNIDTEKVNNIVNDVNKQILSGIREKLKEIYEKTDETMEDENEENLELESREELLKHIENPQPVTKIKIPVLSEQKELPAGNTEEIKIESSKNLSNLSPEKENLIPNKKDTYSILTQKLSGSFKIPTVETNHSIPNVTKDSERNKPELPRVDPYRMPIE